MWTAFIGLNSPCHFSHPFCVPPEFFKFEMGSVVAYVLQMVSEASTVTVIPTPLIHLTTAGDPQPNHPTPAIWQSLSYLTCPQNTVKVPTTACHWTVCRVRRNQLVPSHPPFCSIRPSCTPSHSIGPLPLGLRLRSASVSHSKFRSLKWRRTGRFHQHPHYEAKVHPLGWWLLMYDTHRSTHTWPIPMSGVGPHNGRSAY